MDLFLIAPERACVGKHFVTLIHLWMIWLHSGHFTFFFWEWISLMCRSLSCHLWNFIPQIEHSCNERLFLCCPILKWFFSLSFWVKLALHLNFCPLWTSFLCSTNLSFLLKYCTANPYFEQLYIDTQESNDDHSSPMLLNGKMTYHRTCICNCLEYDASSYSCGQTAHHIRCIASAGQLISLALQQNELVILLFSFYQRVEVPLINGWWFKYDGSGAERFWRSGG